VLTVDTAVLANRENNVRSGFSTPLRPSLRLAWDGVTRPAWSLGTFLCTLARMASAFRELLRRARAPIVRRMSAAISACATT
jgi:L-lactate dehydrogenase (cytochrome)